MSTNMWSNRETMVAYSYLSDELLKNTQYTPDELEKVFNRLVGCVDSTDFVDDIIDSFAARVNWEELSEHHNAENPTWLTNMKFSDEAIEALLLSELWEGLQKFKATEEDNDDPYGEDDIDITGY